MRALTLNADARENELHGEILAAARTTIEKAIRIGELLTARKEKCQHGAWLPWLKANVQFSSSTADNYRAIYEHRAKFPNVGNLTEMLQLINEVRITKKKAKAPKNKPKLQPFSKNVIILEGNCLDILPSLPTESVQMVCTSPPFFGLRSYGDAEGQLGLESTVQEYVKNLLMVFRKIRRVLKPNGIVWLNLASTYGSENGGTPNAPETLSMRHGNGKRGRSDGYNPCRDAKVIAYKHKDLIPIPWLVGLALQKDGWWLRNDCILEKLNVMPYSGEDRCAMSHEYVLLLTKSEHYYFDYQAIMEPADPKYAERYEYGMPGYTNNCQRPNGKADTQGGMRKFQPMRRKRSVWTMATQGYPGHPAAFPEKLVEILRARRIACRKYGFGLFRRKWNCVESVMLIDCGLKDELFYAEHLDRSMNQYIDEFATLVSKGFTGLEIEFETVRRSTFDPHLN
jgi:DNA modification methylase